MSDIDDTKRFYTRFVGDEDGDNDNDYSSDFEESNASFRAATPRRTKASSSPPKENTNANDEQSESRRPILPASERPIAISLPMPLNQTENDRLEEDVVYQSEKVLQPLRSSLSQSLLSSQVTL